MPRRKKASHSRSTPNRNPRDLETLEDDLFQEASSLSATTGAYVAVACLRPSGEVRVWGYPSAESVLNRYQQCARRPSPQAELVEEEEDRARMMHMPREDERNGTPSSEQTATEMDTEIGHLERQIERVRKRISELDAEGRGSSPPA